MTVGIGVICERANCVVVASDSRASYRGSVRPNDSCGKMFDFPPFDCVATIASSVSACQGVISQLTVEIDKLTKLEQVYIDHVIGALIEARFYIQTRRVDLDLRDKLNITLSQWKNGPINPLLLKRGEEIIKAFELNAHVILAGFMKGQLMFFRMLGDAYPEEEAGPGVFVIGTQHASVDANNSLNKHGQNNEFSLARTLVHVYEAMRAARSSLHGEFVGPEAGYVVIRNDGNGIGRLPADLPLLKEWLKRFKKDTSPLDDPAYTRQIDKLILTPSDVQKLRDRQ